LGVLASSLLWGFTLGSHGHSGQALLADLARTDATHALLALAGGAVFNVANLLLVAAIEIAGLAIAFPIGIGLALVVGVALNYVLEPKGNGVMLTAGVTFIILAICFDAVAYWLREKGGSESAERAPSSNRGVLISVVCGVLMGLFYPLLARATDGTRALGPYSVVVIFGAGVAFCALIANTYWMHRPLTGAPAVEIRGYREAPVAWHCWGWIGGIVWGTGMVLSLAASRAHIVGPAVSYAIGQGATMVSALWGVFVWREFAGAPPLSRRLLGPMFVCFAVGLGLLAAAPLWIE
jgi:glucose uptake protein